MTSAIDGHVQRHDRAATGRSAWSSSRSVARARRDVRQPPPRRVRARTRPRSRSTRAARVRCPRSSAGSSSSCSSSAERRQPLADVGAGPPPLGERAGRCWRIVRSSLELRSSVSARPASRRARSPPRTGRARRQVPRARDASTSGRDSISSVEARTERQEIPGEVAAVDRRDIGRRQRRERPRVVPVVEVPAVALHPQQRVEGRLEPVDHAGDARDSRSRGRQRRQELQPDVGRRGAMRDDLGAVLLIVVGDEPVVGRRQQLFEEAPGLSCDAAQCGALFAVERSDGDARAAGRWCGRAAATGTTAPGSATPAAAGAAPAIATDSSATAASTGATHIRSKTPAKRRRHDRSIGGHPLQQVAPRDQHPDQRRGRSHRASPRSDAPA